MCKFSAPQEATHQHAHVVTRTVSSALNVYAPRPESISARTRYSKALYSCLAMIIQCSFRTLRQQCRLPSAVSSLIFIPSSYSITSFCVPSRNEMRPLSKCRPKKMARPSTCKSLAVAMVLSSTPANAFIRPSASASRFVTRRASGESATPGLTKGLSRTAVSVHMIAQPPVKGQKVKIVRNALCRSPQFVQEL